jgi:DNA polymerase III alpha subunit
MKFVHLHVHSHYSLLDGLSKVPDIVRFAQEDGSNAIALTDHGVMYGTIEFYQKCKKAGVKPIIGIEMYTTTGSRFDRTLVKGQKQTNHLILLAKNNVGYKNLLKITSIGHLEGYYYKPRVDWEILEKYHEGLIACSACLGGEIPQLIMNGKDDEAKKRILEYAKLFGPDNYYLELQHHPDLEWQEKVNNKLIAFARELNLPLVATNDPHYVNAQDNEAQDILLCLQNKAKKADTNRMSMLGGNYSLRSTAEMVELFKHVPDAIENTVKIAELCNVEIELGNIQLPHFEVPAGYDGQTYLEKLCKDGLVDRYGKTYEEIEPIYRERLDYELSVIGKMGWPSYFLIVADFVNWARANGIVVGPGRGSAAGSLVSYAVGITSLCPIKYDLLFERFLNPDRISMPDIDLDFADSRRGEVIEYVQHKYGEDHVAQIITFGTMAARAAVRDVGRVLDYPYDFCDKISKAIPMFTKIAQALDTVPDFQEIYQNPDAKKVIDYAIKLEGVARHSSVHACGILITKDPLTDNVPVQHVSSTDKTLVSQYSLHPVEDLGLLKMDFLGLRNLSVIESAINLIKSTCGVEIDINKIPLDDVKTFVLFQKAETTGVFQLECLSGDTIVSNTTIKKLYEKKHREKLLSVYIDNGSVHKNEILQVAQGGVKELYALIADNGWHIKASADHQFLTDDGWKKLSELKIGEKILIKSRAKHLLYNICQSCGKQINGQKDGKSNFCYACSARHYKNPSKAEARAKIKAAQIEFYAKGGQPWNLGLNIENSDKMKITGRKISAALMGKTLEDFYGPEKAAIMRQKMSERYSGKNNPMFGRSPAHSKGGFRQDLGHYVRSSWEADFARILKLHNLAYEYEPQTFALKKDSGEILHYTPDFYTKHNNTFYEIKGWMHEADQEKIDLFQSQYPQYGFVLISATKFAELALQYKQLIAWECPKVPDNFEFVVVKKIVSCGSEMTYDIAMRPPGNNFIANGFVVHNSSGMKRYLRDLQATEFEDIVAMVALYRPGPMEWIPDYIAGKHGKKKIVYLHPKLEPILNKTYGVAIYQEQVMRMARDVAGFTMGEADVLRKAMGKKIAKLLEEQRDKFVKGCIVNGLSQALGEKLYSFIEPFAGYGFNRCLTGDTLITDARTGKQYTLESLYSKHEQKGELPSIFTLTDDWRLAKGKITAVYDNGVKQIYALKTRLGKEIKATANHPFRTIQGWQQLTDLQVGDRIAVARKIALPQRTYKIEDFKLIVLGYLRETVFLIGNILKSKKIIALANPDIYWDEIVEIKKIGKEQTYDLTIENTHNYLANDIVVHNSHAACYAMVGYQTAYLKANYPAQFMAALLTADQQETDRVAIEIEECRNMGIDVKQPDINQSYETFTVVTSGTQTGKQAAPDEKINVIRFGLNAIKNMGAHIAEAIIKERKRNGAYQDMSDFLSRVEDKDLNKKSLESLIKTGAFDNFGERGQLLHNLENMLAFHRQVAQEKNTNQISLFANDDSQAGALKLNLEAAPPVGNLERLTWEKELLGLYISDHPFNNFKRQLSNVITPLSNLKEVGNNAQVSVAGVIISIKKILTRKNDNMLFVKIEDGIGSLEILVFPRLLQTTLAIWQEGAVVICQGSMSDKDGETKILANKCGLLRPDNIAEDVETFRKLEGPPMRGGYSNGNDGQPGSFVRYQKEPTPQLGSAKATLKLVIDYEKLNEELLTRIKTVLASHPGQSRVYLKIIKGDQSRIIESGIRVDNNYNLLAAIKEDFKNIVKVAT